MSKKIVIAFEGIEGSGKTFHIDNVSKYLKRKKIPHIKLREPGGNKNSEKIILLFWPIAPCGFLNIL